MFGFLGLSKDVVKTLKGSYCLFNLSAMLTSLDEYHIYMAENSRVSIAGLNTGNVDYVARSIAEVLEKTDNV